MDKKMIGTTLGVVGVILWFQPFVSFGRLFQSGQHIGGLAYVLLAASIIFATASYFEKFDLVKLLSFVILGLTSLLVFQYMGKSGWGLISYLILAIYSVYYALEPKKKDIEKEPFPVKSYDSAAIKSFIFNGQLKEIKLAAESGYDFTKNIEEFIELAELNNHKEIEEYLDSIVKVA
jgi:hypothetical protein